MRCRASGNPAVRGTCTTGNTCLVPQSSWPATLRRDCRSEAATTKGTNCDLVGAPAPLRRGVSDHRRDCDCVERGTVLSANIQAVLKPEVGTCSIPSDKWRVEVSKTIRVPSTTHP